MGRSLGRAVKEEAIDRLPHNIRKPLVHAISRGAKATRKLRDKEEIKRRGQAWTANVKKSIAKNMPKIR